MKSTFREEIYSAPSRIPLTWLTNLSMDQLRNELSRLPDHTVVLYLVMFQDAAGQTFTPRQALDQFAPASRAPIYGHYDTFLGHGIVGGTMVTFEQIGQKTAQLGMRILAGEDPPTAARAWPAIRKRPGRPPNRPRQARRWPIRSTRRRV